MKAASGIVLLILAGTALADPVKIMEPCHPTDYECLKKITIDFFTKTSGGLPELGTDSIDPLGIPTFDVVFGGDIGVTFKLRNLYVTGLRHSKFHDLSLDKQTRKLEFTLEADLFIGANVDIDYAKKLKTFTGYFTSQPTVKYTNKCDLPITKSNDGVEHYNYGPETITYELLTAPQLDWSDDLKAELDNDASWKSQSEETFKKFDKQTIDEIVSKALPSVISNVRKAAKVLPASAILIE